MNELIQEGYVKESADQSEPLEAISSGRKAVFLEVRTDNYFTIGVYISRDYATVILSNLKCEILLEKKCVFSFEESDETFVSKLKVLVYEMINSDYAKEKKIMAIGISSIGPVDCVRGIILDPPNFHRLKSIPIKQIFEEEFKLKVFIDNDMNASAIAEKFYGSGKNLSNFVYVGVTNGIGAGIITNSVLYQGDRGFGGEIGHISINFEGPDCVCGNKGCLELYASIPETVKQAKSAISLGMESSLSKIVDLEWKDIVDAAKQGDKLAVNLIEKLCLYISIGVISICNIFDPQKIYLGHDIAHGGELVTEKILSNISGKTISSKYKTIPIEISKFIDKAPIIGSVAIVLEHLFNGEVG